MDQITLADGRAVSFADYGEAGETPVLWAHGGPGSRLEPEGLAPYARAAGFRLIGIDRPGYGGSTPQPGRTIGDWPAEALALADHLGLNRFLVVGCSTGGAYALALAAASPRVAGAVACCALTDMRWREGREMMPDATTVVWNAPSREAALAAAEDLMGADGSKMMAALPPGDFLPPSDMALMMAPESVAAVPTLNAARFAQGVVGYVDDRLADGPGWGSFDLAAIRCPVIVLHGEADPIVPVAQAHHTASIVPGAQLSIHPGLGHFSIVGAALGALVALRDA
jgi:pimeloyl-ACP methyl ester carboxylesterase